MQITVEITIEITVEITTEITVEITIEITVEITDEIRTDEIIIIIYHDVVLTLTIIFIFYVLL